MRLIAKALRFQDFNTDPVVSPAFSLSGFDHLLQCFCVCAWHTREGKEQQKEASWGLPLSTDCNSELSLYIKKKKRTGEKKTGRKRPSCQPVIEDKIKE